MRVGAFELVEPLPKLREPHVLATLQPWIDAGSVGTLVFSWLESQFTAIDLAELVRPGDFFDFTRYRPTSYYKEGQRQLIIPNTRISYLTQNTGNDLLLVHLLEPHSHGEDYVDSVLQVLEKLEVKSYTLIGSMYDYMPHTRPLIVTGSLGANQTEQEANKLGIRRSHYQGPSTITALISQRASLAGVKTMRFVVHLPQYTQLEEDYMGAVRIIEVLSLLYGLPKNETYINNAERQKEQIIDALEKNPQLKTVVEQLENHYDSPTERTREEEMPRLSPEVESFLAEMDRRFRED
ncbi:PAC2 family protein [Chloroflexota bacterium]